MQLNNNDRSLLDLARMARGGKHGVFPGVSVYRHRDQLWIPLTEVCRDLTAYLNVLHTSMSRSYPLVPATAACLASGRGITYSS